MQAAAYLYLSSISSCDVRDRPTSFLFYAFLMILCKKLVETGKNLVVNHKLNTMKQVTVSSFRNKTNNKYDEVLSCKIIHSTHFN